MRPIPSFWSCKITAYQRDGGGGCGDVGKKPSVKLGSPVRIIIIATNEMHGGE
jgi:hypothetical protein